MRNSFFHLLRADSSVARRRVLLAGALLAASIALPMAPALARDAGQRASAHWVGTWGTAPADAPTGAQRLSFSDQTLRLIVHTSVGGTQVRVRLSNELGTTPLQIGAVHVALRKSGAGIVAGTDRALTFSGAGAITLPAGAPVLSDPVDLDVPAAADLAVSVHLPGQVEASTVHNSAFQTNYVSAQGDFSGAAEFPVKSTLTSWPFLTEVDVSSAQSEAAVVAFGDSITDGSNTSADTNRRWPDLLALRTQVVAGKPAGKAHGAGIRLAIVNRGIGGNRLLRDPGSWPPFGKAALARFDRDVLATTGAQYVIVLIGINDIGHPGSNSAAGEPLVTPEQLIAGYRQLIARAHAKGLAIFGATLTPFEGTVFPGYYSEEKEALRAAVNQWIRSGKEFDAVIDFDRAVRDPSHPIRMLPAFDSGDHLHPNDQGMQAMANAVPLALFHARAVTQARATSHQ